MAQTVLELFVQYIYIYNDVVSSSDLEPNKFKEVVIDKLCLFLFVLSDKFC